ncbi:MAG: hypothetical protein QG597_4136 [Actinomycetota bacterium]|nr:hypothetical protein [Actinomycetota bacterium]
MAVGAIGWAASAGAVDPRPTAEELLIAVQQPTATDLTGTTLTRVDLGLPAGIEGLVDLPAPLNAASGEVAAQVWVDGPDRQRITALADVSATASATVADTQLSAVRDGDTVVVWSAEDATATTYTAAPDAAAKAEAQAPGTPAEVAREALAALGEDADVTVADSPPMAGRDTVALVVDPRDSKTLVSQVTITFDRETNVVLGVQVGSTRLPGPAVDIAFTSVSYDQVNAEVFGFTPPVGATVVDKTMGTDSESPKPEPEVVGDGWSAVAVGEVQMPGAPGQSAPGDLMAGLEDEQRSTAMEALGAYLSLPTVNGAWGSGRVLTGTLFSAIITDDGRYAVGAVDVETLGAALAQQR